MKTQAPPGSDNITDWLRQQEDAGCHEAADTIDRLTRERDDARARAEKAELLVKEAAYMLGVKYPGLQTQWNRLARWRQEAREAGILEDEK